MIEPKTSKTKYIKWIKTRKLKTSTVSQNPNVTTEKSKIQTTIHTVTLTRNLYRCLTMYMVCHHQLWFRPLQRARKYCFLIIHYSNNARFIFKSTSQQRNKTIKYDFSYICKCCKLLYTCNVVLLLKFLVYVRFLYMNQLKRMKQVMKTCQQNKCCEMKNVFVMKLNFFSKIFQ